MQGKNPKKDEVTVALLQMALSKDPSENLAKAVKKIDEAASKGAQIICLPELFKSQYFCQTEDEDNFEQAETIPGETTKAISQAAKKNKVTVIAGIFEKRTRGIYHNSAAIIDSDGSLVGTYRKMHIPDDPHFTEKFYFTPGDLGFSAHSTAYGKIGVLICWDQWFPEAARITALKGAHMLFYPTAIGWIHPEEKDTAKDMQSAWEISQRAHAISNGVFVAAVNRVGMEGKLKFWGSSFISDPFGRIIAKASQDNEEILIAKCDMSLVDSTRHGWPFLRDRRIDAYKDITSIFLD